MLISPASGTGFISWGVRAEFLERATDALDGTGHWIDDPGYRADALSNVAQQ